MKQYHGLTLLELLIYLLIISLILGIAIPGFSKQVQKSRTHSATQLLLTSVITARTMAVAKNQRSIMAANNKKWEDGWVIFMDLNNNGYQDPIEPTAQEFKKLKGVKITANAPVKKYISFIGTGEGRKAGKANAGAFITGTLTVCPENKGRGYKLVLSRGGRLRSQAINEADCAKNA